MLKVILLITIITSISFSQKMKLDIKDSLTYRAVILDSINIKNKTLGIDTTVANPVDIDLTNLLIANSVPKEQYYNISFNNNQLEVISNENIDNIQLVDLLGREVINTNVNNTSFRANIENSYNSFLYFISIKTKNEYYHSKIVNSTYKNLQTTYVLPNTINWEFTLYKLGYKSEKVEIDTIPQILQEMINKIPLVVNCNIYCENMYRSDNNGSYMGTESLGLNFTLNLFSAEEYVNSYMASPQCYYIGDSGYDFVGDVQIDGNYFRYGLFSTNESDPSEIFFEDSSVSGYDLYAICMNLSINKFNFNDLYSNKLDTLIFDFSKKEASIGYEYKHEFVWSPGTYRRESFYIGTKTLVTGTIEVSIKK